MTVRAKTRVRRRQTGGLEEIRAAIATHYDKLSPGQRRVIDRLLADARFGAVVSAAALADEVGLSESTVTRAAQALGFAGYPELQSRLREEFVGRVPERMKKGAAVLGDSAEAAAVRVMLEDIESLQATVDQLKMATLERVVDALVGARRVYIFGSRGSHGLGVMLSVGLELLLPDVRLLSQSHGNLPDQLLRVEPEDALVAISFPRVDRVTVKVMRHFRSTGATTMGIAASLASPISRLADYALPVQLSPLRLIPSFAAGASMVNALVTAVSVRTAKAAAPDLNNAERLWATFGTWEETQPAQPTTAPASLPHER